MAVDDEEQVDDDEEQREAAETDQSDDTHGSEEIEEAEEEEEEEEETKESVTLPSTAVALDVKEHPTSIQCGDWISYQSPVSESSTPQLCMLIYMICFPALQRNDAHVLRYRNTQLAFRCPESRHGRLLGSIQARAQARGRWRFGIQARARGHTGVRFACRL